MTGNTFDKRQKINFHEDLFSLYHVAWIICGYLDFANFIDSFV